MKNVQTPPEQTKRNSFERSKGMFTAMFAQTARPQRTLKGIKTDYRLIFAFYFRTLWESCRPARITLNINEIIRNERLQSPVGGVTRRILSLSRDSKDPLYGYFVRREAFCCNYK